MTILKVVTPGNLDTAFDLSGSKISLKLDSTLRQDSGTGAIGVAKVTAVKKSSQSVGGTVMTNDSALFLDLTPGWWQVEAFIKYTSGARNDSPMCVTVTS